MRRRHELLQLTRLVPPDAERVRLTKRKLQGALLTGSKAASAVGSFQTLMLSGASTKQPKPAAAAAAAATSPADAGKRGAADGAAAAAAATPPMVKRTMSMSGKVGGGLGGGAEQILKGQAKQAAIITKEIGTLGERLGALESGQRAVRDEIAALRDEHARFFARLEQRLAPP